MLFHELHKAYEAVKKLGEELFDEDGNAEIVESYGPDFANLKQSVAL